MATKAERYQHLDLPKAFVRETLAKNPLVSSEDLHRLVWEKFQHRFHAKTIANLRTLAGAPVSGVMKRARVRELLQAHHGAIADIAIVNILKQEFKVAYVHRQMLRAARQELGYPLYEDKMATREEVARLLLIEYEGRITHKEIVKRLREQFGTALRRGRITALRLELGYPKMYRGLRGPQVKRKKRG